MKDRARNDMALEKFNNNTSVTKKLSQNINCWKNWPPSWIDGRRMLMLSGMVTDNEGRLIKGTVEIGQVPIGCQERCRRIVNHGNDTKWDSETVLHRAVCCIRYKNERQLIRRTINQAINEEKNMDKL